MRNRVAGSWGGALWLVLQPLLLILIFIFLFSIVLRVKLNELNVGTKSFSLFLISGLLPWFALQEGVTKSMVSILENREVIKKIHLPLEAIPCGYALSIQIIYGVVFLLFSGFCIFRIVFLGKISPLTAIYVFFSIPVIYTLQFFLSLGLGFITSAISVFVRDTLQVVPLIFQIWFYVSPIVYPESLVPSRFRFLLELNLYNVFLKSYRNLLLKGAIPDLKSWIIIFIFSFGVFFVGYELFNSLKESFVDVL